MQTPVIDGSQAGMLRKMFATNSTVTGGYTAKIPTTTAPSGDGVIKANPSGNWVPTRAKLLFFGVGANNTTFNARIIGWQEVANKLYVPIELWEGTVTLSSSQPGVDSATGFTTPIDSTNLFADTIVTSKGTDGENCWPFSPANDQIGHLVLDLKGTVWQEAVLDRNGSATSANVLLAYL